MLIGSKKGIFAVISMAVLLCGCKNTTYVAMMEPEKIQSNENQSNTYIIIEESEVPMAPVPDEPEEAQAETDRRESVPEEAEKPSEVSKQPVPTQEVDVYLQTEDVQADIAMETEVMITAEGSFDATAFSEEILRAVNEERASAGFPGLTVTQELSAAAEKRANEISSHFSHIRPGGGDYSTAISEAGGSYGYVGENLFRGTDNIAALEAAWDNSSFHMENILDGHFLHIGIGVAETPDGIYVVQMFTD